MKIKTDYSEELKSMTLELISESDVEQNIMEILWRDSFEVRILRRNNDYTSVVLSKKVGGISR